MGRLVLNAVMNLVLVSAFMKEGEVLVVAWSPSSLGSNRKIQQEAIPSTVRFRTGMKTDEIPIAATMMQNLMNPLGINSENFIVAEEKETGERIGWAQIRPLGGTGKEGTSTAEPDPNTWNARPGSRKVMRDDVEETIWDEFEQDNAPFPNGFASLPWTKEYRLANEAAEKRKRRRELLLEQELAEQPTLLELASVFVVPGWRKQGLGTGLVKEVLKRHEVQGRALQNVYALTLVPTVGWYLKVGFEVVRPDSEIPESMSFEILAGRIITKLIGAELACIRYGG